MAESKNSDPKPMNDVSHPGKSVPSNTSKPVIVTNRPILKDPMVNAEVPNSINIEVKTSAKPFAEPLTVPEVDKKADPKKTIAELAETAGKEKTEKKEESEEPAPVDNKPADEPSEPNDGPAQTETPAEDEPASDAGKKNPEQSNERIEEIKSEEEAKRQTAVQALIESKKYHLPINSVEQRRSKRVVFLGILLSLVLALAWVDIALDAGLIELDGVKALTHFFST